MFPCHGLGTTWKFLPHLIILCHPYPKKSLIPLVLLWLLTHPFSRMCFCIDFLPSFPWSSPKGAKTHRPQAKTCDKSSRREAQRAMLCKGVPSRGKKIGELVGELLRFGDYFLEKRIVLMDSDPVETF